MTRYPRPLLPLIAAAAALTLIGAFTLRMSARSATAQAPSPVTSELREPVAPQDWDFLLGSWTVQHRRLKDRLAGSTEWEEFSGTNVVWKTLGGLGTVDDNMLEHPSGTYRALAVRAYDTKTRQWSIWWFDTRYLGLPLEPVRGGFRDGTGTFHGDAVHAGKPIKVRFLWSRITPTSARWEQAFSPDGGTTWETNWIMDFTRAGPPQAS
jgi:hypothetical protein